MLLTGGTGLSSRDQTFETVTVAVHEEIPGYGELFRMLSYQEIGAAAMLSRATAGLMDRTRRPHHARLPRRRPPGHGKD